MANGMSPQQAQQQQPTADDIDRDFVNTLEDSVLILKKMGPLVDDLDGLIEMLELAIKNSSQRNTIMQLVMPTRMRGR